MAVKPSDHMEETAVTLQGFFPSFFFVWTGLGLSSIFVRRADVLIFIAENSDEKSTSVSDVASMVQCVFVLIVVGSENALI